MPKWTLSGGENVGTIKSTGTITETLPDVDVGMAKADGDYLDQLDQMGKQMQTIADTQSSVLELPDFSGAEIEIRAPIEEAKELIGKKQYDEALELLRGVLTSPSEPHEAVYLIALCHYHLSKLEEALAALKPLRDVTLEPQVARPVKQLKPQIRQKILALVVIENLLLVRQGKAEKPIERLRRLTNLDPQFGLFHFLLAGNLMTAERVEEALEAAEVGLRECDPEHRKQLEGMKENIVSRLLEVEMDAARSHYREGKYANARSALESLDARYQKSKLWIAFHDYLGELSSTRGKKPQDVKPAGAFKDVDALHFFLVRKEIGEAKLAISVGMLGPAQRVLEAALSYAPYFPYIHFLTALCIYRRTGQALGSDSPPSPDEAIANLNTALAHAREGVKDKEIGSAKDLEGVIKNAIELMGSVKKELDIRRRDAQKVNGVVEDYKAVMELVGDGISSPEQWREVCMAMGKVKKKIASVRGKVTQPDGRQALDQLERVVDSNIDQLDALEPKIKEAEEIKEAMEEFNSIMSSAEGGVSSLDHAERLESRLAKLSKRVKALRKSADKEAKETLKRLQEAVDRNHGQVKDILKKKPSKAQQKAQQQVTEFNELAMEFHMLMESAKKHPISSQDELLEFAGNLTRVSARAKTLKGEMKDKEGKEAADQLIKAIEAIFQQLIPR